MRDLVWAALRWVARGLAAVLGGVRIEGAGNVPRRGPVLLVANHLSDVDPVIVAMGMPRTARFMAKSELFEIRVLGPLIRWLGAFPVRRDSADRAAIRLTEEIIQSGDAVVLFPEGRLSETGAMTPFQPGAALLALRTGAPVIPIGLIGTPEMLPYGHLVPRRAARPVRVRYGAPVPLDDLKGLPRHEALRETARRMERAVAGLAEQPLPTEGPAPSCIQAP